MPIQRRGVYASGLAGIACVLPPLQDNCGLIYSHAVEAEPIGEKDIVGSASPLPAIQGQGALRSALGRLQRSVRRSPHQRWFDAPMLMPPNLMAVTGLAFEARIAAGRPWHQCSLTEGEPN
jgi:hypothetical protein